MKSTASDHSDFHRHGTLLGLALGWAVEGRSLAIHIRRRDHHREYCWVCVEDMLTGVFRWCSTLLFSRCHCTRTLLAASSCTGSAILEYVITTGAYQVLGVSEADMGAIDGCGTTDLELDQRNMLGRHREARSSGGNGE
jgi:hypothetical protein